MPQLRIEEAIEGPKDGEGADRVCQGVGDSAWMAKASLVLPHPRDTVLNEEVHDRMLDEEAEQHGHY